MARERRRRPDGNGERRGQAQGGGARGNARPEAHEEQVYDQNRRLIWETCWANGGEWAGAGLGTKKKQPRRLKSIENPFASHDACVGFREKSARVVCVASHRLFHMYPSKGHLSFARKKASFPGERRRDASVSRPIRTLPSLKRPSSRTRARRHRSRPRSAFLALGTHSTVHRYQPAPWPPSPPSLSPRRRTPRACAPPSTALGSHVRLRRRVGQACVDRRPSNARRGLKVVANAAPLATRSSPAVFNTVCATAEKKAAQDPTTTLVLGFSAGALHLSALADELHGARPRRRRRQPRFVQLPERRGRFTRRPDPGDPTGAELFTGNVMTMLSGVLAKHVKIEALIRNGSCRIAGNSIGSVAMATFAAPRPAAPAAKAAVIGIATTKASCRSASLSSRAFW